MTGSNSWRKVPIHKSACPRESLVNDLSRLTYILCRCLFLTASHDNLLASRSDPLEYLPSEDGESIQQKLTFKDGDLFKRSVRSVLSAVGKSETPSTLRSPSKKNMYPHEKQRLRAKNHHRIPHDHEANAAVNPRSS